MSGRFLGLCLTLALLSNAAAESPPYKPAANADQAVERIEELGGIVRKAAAKGDALDVDLRNSTIADAHLQLLHALKNVEVLRLQRTAVTDAGLAHVGKLTSLKRLYLEQTAISDAGLKHLGGLKDLEVLNLLGCPVGDPGLQQVAALPKLKELNVSETKATEGSIRAWRKARSTLQITPDRDLDRTRAEISWKTAKEALATAEVRIVEVEKDHKELMPRIANLKNEMEAASKKLEADRKAADALRNPYDEAMAKVNELKGPLETADRRAKASPKDAAAQQAFDEAARRMEVAKKLLAERKQVYEDAAAVAKASEAAQREASRLHSKAAAAAKTLEDWKKQIDAYRQLEADARRHFEEAKGYAVKQ